MAMTDTPALNRQLDQVLAEAVPEYTNRNEALILAGRALAGHGNREHHKMHANTQRLGAIVWGLREADKSWHEIRTATGISQRSGQRWLDLFLAEGLTPQNPDDLNRRAEDYRDNR